MIACMPNLLLDLWNVEVLTALRNAWCSHESLVKGRLVLQITVKVLSNVLQRVC